MYGNYYPKRRKRAGKKDYKVNKDRSYSRNRKVTSYTGQSSQSDDVWDSGMTIMDDPTVIVPEKVREICIAIQEEVGRPEWGALFKGEWTDNGFKVKPDYVIPEQKVSRTHIDFEEDLKKYRDKGYVVHVHSHPFSGRKSGFSGTDDAHSNSHFELALLYAGKAEDIVDARLNVDVNDGIKLQVSPQIEVKRERATLPDVDTGKIEKRSTQGGGSTASESFGYSETGESWTGDDMERFQNEAIENAEVTKNETVRIPASNIKSGVETFEEMDGVEVFYKEEDKNPEEDGDGSESGQ